MKMSLSRRVLFLSLLITPLCWTPLHAQACNKTPTLTGPTSVTRGSAPVTYTIGNLCKTYTVSGWTFTAGGTPWPRTTSTSATTWSGRMVQSGTVKVNVAQGGTTYPLSVAVTVNPRTTGFAFTAKPATQYPNGTFHCVNPPEDLLLAVPDPPTQTGEAIGLSIACLRYSFDFTQVPDTGPNGSFWYVTAARDSAPGETPTATTFAWTLSQQLDDPNSDFYKAQCGSGGFISGAQLKTNTVNHESGTVTANSHYSQYVAAQNNPANNVGTGLEAVVGPRSDSIDDFRTRVQSEANARQGRIKTATQVEPCGGDVTKDENCVFKGSVNYPPYQTCPGCQSNADCSSHPAPYNQCLSNGQCGNAACPAAPPASSTCISSGSVDDILGNTNCCSGMSVPGSGCCIYEGDWGGTWASCSQICG